MSTEIKVGDTVRITEQYAVDSYQSGGNDVGVEFEVTEVTPCLWKDPKGRQRQFYVSGDPAQRGLWDLHIEKVEPAIERPFKKGDRITTTSANQARGVATVVFLPEEIERSERGLYAIRFDSYGYQKARNFTSPDNLDYHTATEEHMVLVESYDLDATEEAEAPVEVKPEGIIEQRLAEYNSLKALGFTDHQARAMMTAEAIRSANESKVTVAEAAAVSSEIEERKMQALERIAEALGAAQAGQNYGFHVKVSEG